MPTYGKIPMSYVLYSTDNIGHNLSCFLWIDKVRMYEEMMTNDDNLESSLLTSNLLKMHSLYKFCRVLLQVAHVKLEI